MANDVLMTLGASDTGFVFSMASAAYDALTRSTDWRWASNPVIGRRPALQGIGPGGDTITLTGSVYPHFRGGLGQIAQMRELAGRMQPLLLTSGRGDILGRVVIVRLEEGQTFLMADGAPQRQAFTLELSFYE